VLVESVFEKIAAAPATPSALPLNLLVKMVFFASGTVALPAEKAKIQIVFTDAGYSGVAFFGSTCVMTFTFFAPYFKKNSADDVARELAHYLRNFDGTHFSAI